MLQVILISSALLGGYLQNKVIDILKILPMKWFLISNLLKIIFL